MKNDFKDNIELYSVYKENECIAGVVMYISENVAHVQYISANETGKDISALDFLFGYLINEKYQHTHYFDFGTSVENQGYYLNEGLTFQKQGFGARGVVYKQYEYEHFKEMVHFQEKKNTRRKKHDTLPRLKSS